MFAIDEDSRREVASDHSAAQMCHRHPRALLASVTPYRVRAGGIGRRTYQRTLT
jgi:hypothetical protein